MHHMSGDCYDNPRSGLTAGIFPYPAEPFVKNGSTFSSVLWFRLADRLNIGVAARAEVSNGEYASGDYFRGPGLSPHCSWRMTTVQELMRWLSLA